MSQIGAWIEKMCKMENASFFLNLRKRKLHVELKPDLYDFCGHLSSVARGNFPVRVDTSLKQLVKPSGNLQYSMCVKKRRKKQLVWQKCYFYAAMGLKKFSGEPRWLIVQYTEKWLLSQIGAWIEKMCKMKNASFFLKLKEAKVACRNLTWFIWLLRTFKAMLLRDVPQ